MIINALILALSVWLGAGIVVYLQKINQNKVIKVLLSLSGGFLLAMAFIHFIPEMYAHNEGNIGYFILLGFLLQLVLEYFSKGIEHGHIHGGKQNAVPWSLFIALSFHSVFEALPLASMVTDLFPNAHEAAHTHHYHNMSGEGFTLGIALHNIPLGIALMTLLISSGFKRSKAWVLIAIFSLMSPLGMFLGYFLDPSLVNMQYILAIVVGMFLHISTTIIFESSDNHKFNFLKLISLLAGVGLAALII